MDGILEGPMNEPVFSTAAKDLLGRFQDRLVPLSVERVGHHTVKKLFSALPDMDDRIVLAEELSSGINRLSGNAMGRSVMESCALKEFGEGIDVWKNAVSKMINRDQWLKEITGDGDGEKETSKLPGKKKRKRKRHGAKDSSKGEVVDDEEDGLTKKAAVSSTVGSIMDAMSVAIKP